MGRIPDSPNIIIFCATHPTPFIPTTHGSRQTLDMITPIHFLNPSPAETRFGITPQPGSRFGIRSKLLCSKMIQILGTVDIWMDWSAATETGFEVTGETSEVGRRFYVQMGGKGDGDLRRR